MAIDELSRFLQSASGLGELLRVDGETQTRFELAAVAERLGRETAGAGPALLFENVRGHALPVAANLWNQRERFLRALDVPDLADVVTRLTGVFNPLITSKNWTETLKASASSLDRSRFLARSVRRGLCQQVIELGRDLNLRNLPIPHCWPGESNRTLTAGQLILRGLDGRTLLTDDVAEVVDGESLLLHWEADSPARQLFEGYRRANRQMPAAISLGGDPLFMYVASLPLPAAIDPWYFAGVLRNENVNLIRARSVELDVPAEAEIIIEGYLDPIPPEGSGRVVNRLGFITENRNLPLLRVTAVTHRANPILPVLIRSPAYHEAAVANELTELLLLELLRPTVPAIRDLHLPVWGQGRQSLIASLDHDDASTVQRVAHAVNSLPLASLAKLIVIVDAEVNIRQATDVWREVCRYADFRKDVEQRQGVPDPCDPTQVAGASGAKLIIDATRKTSRSQATPHLPCPAAAPPELATWLDGHSEKPSYPDD